MGGQQKRVNRVASYLEVAVLEAGRVPFEYRPSRLLGEQQVLLDVVAELRVGDARVLRLAHHDAVAGGVHVVVHPEVRGHAVHEHALVRRHRRELVNVAAGTTI